MLFDLFIKVVPKKKLSYLTGRLVRLKRPKWLARKAALTFARYYNLNLHEAEFSLETYQCVGDLFTRRLKEGMRPVADSPLVHPADAEITERGLITQGQMIQAKEARYSIDDFLHDGEASKCFEGGYFLTYYLCPTDYHRVHFPVSGQVTDVIHVPGALWPVNPWSVRNIKDLFAINERVILRLQTEFGKMAVVMVGATNVGEMSLSFEPSVRSNRPGQNTPNIIHYDEPRAVEKGAELGIFHMGSTVIIVMDKAHIDALPSLLEVPGGAVKMGASLADPQKWQ